MAHFEPYEPPKSLRIFNPQPGVFAYYDGRTGERLYSPQPNWLDDGAFVLGVASYSIVSGAEALIYDAHITPGHAKAVQSHLRSLGVTKMMVVYSHHHKDHIAGAEGYEDCDFIAHRDTARVLEGSQDSLASESPPVHLVMPTKLYDSQLTIRVGEINAELHHFNIHTSDGTVLWLPHQQLLLVGDALEDTVSYISEPASSSTHEKELQRLALFPIKKILPAHGSPDLIGSGGYSPKLIQATLDYLAAVNEQVDSPTAWSQTLQELVAPDLRSGTLVYHPPYDEVHKANIKLIKELRSSGAKRAVTP